MAASPILVLPVLLVAGPWVFLACAIAGLLFWSPGHNFDSDSALLKRYGPFGLAWIVCRRYWRPEWKIGAVVMGWTEAAEVLAGFSFYLAVNGVAILLA
jgi:hypothetical protein